MWANAQRDGACRIELAPSVQRRKVWLPPTTGVTCSNATKTRNPLKLARVPQSRGPISATSVEPKFIILWERLEIVVLLQKPNFHHHRHHAA